MVFRKGPLVNNCERTIHEQRIDPIMVLKSKSKSVPLHESKQLQCSGRFEEAV